MGRLGPVGALLSRSRNSNARPITQGVIGGVAQPQPTTRAVTYIDPDGRNNYLWSMKVARVPDHVLVGAAEAAFIADLDPKDLNRVVDETVLPAELISRATDSRRYAPLGAAFARFYFDQAQALTKGARVAIIERAMELLRPRESLVAILGLSGPLSTIDWSMRLGDVTVNLANAIVRAAERSDRSRKARALVVESGDVLGGRPVFQGTRIPIDVAVGAPTSGPAWDRLKRAYPSLTPDHVDAANVYAVISPRRGRPAKNGKWKLLSTRRIPPGA